MLQLLRLFPFILGVQVTDDYTVIGRNLFKKETNLQLFVGLKVTLSTGETGVIEGGFGQSGKFKIRVQGETYTMWGLKKLFQEKEFCSTLLRWPRDESVGQSHTDGSTRLDSTRLCFHYVKMNGIWVKRSRCYKNSGGCALMMQRHPGTST